METDRKKREVVRMSMITEGLIFRYVANSEFLPWTKRVSIVLQTK